MKDFNNKTALITGAGNGLGRAIALLLAEKNCHLILIDLDSKGLEETKSLLSARTVQCDLYCLDLEDEKAVESLALEVSKNHLELHLLINSAGVSINAPLLEQSMEDFKWLTNINYFGVVHVCKFFLPQLLKSREGHIVNVSSGAAFQGMPRRTAYCGSKFALRGFSEALRAELYGSGIGVSCVFPGPIQTEMFTRSKYAAESDRDKERNYLLQKGDTPEYVAKQILNGIRKNRNQILVRNEVKIGAFFKRLFPNLFADLIGRFRDRLPV